MNTVTVGCLDCRTIGSMTLARLGALEPACCDSCGSSNIDAIEDDDGLNVNAALEVEGSATATMDFSDDVGHGGFIQALVDWLRGGHTHDIPEWFPKRWLTPEEIATHHWSTGGGSPNYAFGSKTATDDGATDKCRYCGLPIKDVEDYGWIAYPASVAHSDEPEVCFSNAWGHEPAGSKTASDKAPSAPEGWDGAAPEACDHFEDDGSGTCTNCWWAMGAHSAKAGGPTGHGADPKTAADDGSIFCQRCKGNGMVNMGGAIRNCTKCKGTGLKPGPRKVVKDVMPDYQASVEDDGNQPAVDWLLRLRQLQAEGMSFEEALAQANAEADGIDTHASILNSLADVHAEAESILAEGRASKRPPISLRAFITDVNEIPVENPNVFDEPTPTMTSDLMRCSNCFHEWKYSTVDPGQPVPLCPNCGSTATTPAGANGVAAVAAQQAKHQAKVAHKITEVTVGILATNPGMDFQAASTLAEQTVRSYPKMVNA